MLFPLNNPQLAHSALNWSNTHIENTDVESIARSDGLPLPPTEPLLQLAHLVINHLHHTSVQCIRTAHHLLKCLASRPSQTIQVILR